MAWLDGLSDKSVVYASLGSLATISREQFTEFFSGLVAAGYPFLWVLRSDMVKASPDAAALREAVVREAGDGKARVVAWAPQRDVLRHRAMGCFLTHAGWNSTLEAVVAGVPTVCRPISSDQQTNSRFVGAVWRTGLDMKNVCDRAVVERTVREAMESGEIRRSAQALLHHRKAPASFLGFRIWECIGRGKWITAVRLLSGGHNSECCEFLQHFSTITYITLKILKIRR
uniref:Uncharacterized protein n=1 Tax=Setaria viridis TaxID=4556 RepID=A0A4U6W0L4_SETVI|nr:hypothetical protein SEVIR_2G329233v2 [Setaria viridis]